MKLSNHSGENVMSKKPVKTPIFVQFVKNQSSYPLPRKYRQGNVTNADIRNYKKTMVYHLTEYYFSKSLLSRMYHFKQMRRYGQKVIYNKLRTHNSALLFYAREMKRMSFMQTINLDFLLEARKAAKMTVDRRFLVRLHGNQCHYCKKETSLESSFEADSATVDHLKPLSKGGAKFNPANLVIACLTCNRKKGNKQLVTFLQEI